MLLDQKEKHLEGSSGGQEQDKPLSQGVTGGTPGRGRALVGISVVAKGIKLGLGPDDDDLSGDGRRFAENV